MRGVQRGRVSRGRTGARYLHRVPSLERIRRALGEHEPLALDVEGRRHAAVALVLREAAHGRPEVLFIERAHHEGDPWSGHMAFPGGGVEPGDADAQAAAERETFEEVGIPLGDAERIGRLDDKEGNPLTHPRLVISAYVFRVRGAVDPVPNHEVREAFWFPVASLLDPARHVDYRIPRGGPAFPGILVGVPKRHVVWGLTYNFLESFFHLVGRPLPDRWTEETRRFARRAHEGR
jgi:8-oxo-dGTP pyrophosphatase MutT (NUDIX family)